MRSLAAFIMRGRVQAVLVAVVTSLVPLLGWFGAVALALVTLRQGAGYGLTVAAAAWALLAVAYGLLAGLPQLALQPVLELWLPTLVLALWLRRTVSLPSTLRLAGCLAGAAVLWLHFAYPDPAAAFWAPLMELVGSVAGDQGTSANENWAVFSERVLPLMTGLWALSLEAAAVAALLLARWLQSLLYYPGGFRKEFHALDLGRPAAIVTGALLIAATVAGYGLVYDLALVVSAVFVLQALALAHGLVAARGWGRGWLIALYVLLPLLFELLVVVGIADAAFNWRRRLMARSGGDSA